MTDAADAEPVEAIARRVVTYWLKHTDRQGEALIAEIAAALTAARKRADALEQYLYEARNPMLPSGETITIGEMHTNWQAAEARVAALEAEQRHVTRSWIAEQERATAAEDREARQKTAVTHWLTEAQQEHTARIRAEDRVIAMKEALRVFGTHRYECAALGTAKSPINAFLIQNPGPCDCGLAALLG